MRTTTPTSIEEYIATSAAAARPILRRIRRVIRASAPEATELISYRMPAFRQRGILVYFAAFTSHIGLFPPVRGDATLVKALAPYAGPKGNLKFPLDEPMPYALIGRIVRLRVKQDSAKARAKPKRRASVRKPGRKRVNKVPSGTESGRVRQS